MQKQQEFKPDNEEQNQMEFVSFSLKESANNLIPSVSYQQVKEDKKQDEFITQNNEKSNTITPVIQAQERKYKRSKYFLDSSNWKRNEKNNRVMLLNKQWKSNSSKIVGFVLKKFITTGSFMGLSFPVFAMKPQGILQSYANSLGVAPILFTDVTSHEQRMKNYIAFIFTVSFLHFDSRKPFNPVIGQTFQASIGGGNYSAEQICHHPPISAFYFQGKGYKIYGQLQLSASLSLNSGEGRFLGDITVLFDDGYWIKGRIPNGQLSGFVYGDTEFNVFGGSYAYDSEGVVSTYQLGSNYIFDGLIGKLNEKSQKKFNETLKSNQRFIKFSSFKKDEYKTVFNRFNVKVGFWISFDGVKQFSFDDQRFFPYQPDNIDNPKLLLKSDSRYRKDIACAREKKNDKGQQQKQMLEQEQRRLRKLREKYTKQKK